MHVRDKILRVKTKDLYDRAKTVGEEIVFFYRVDAPTKRRTIILHGGVISQADFSDAGTSLSRQPA